MSQGKPFRMDAARGCDWCQPCAHWFIDRRSRTERSETDGSSADFSSPRSATKRRIRRRLDAAGWGLFFIWVGVSFLMDLEWGVGLLGVAAVISLKQAARKYFGLRFERFWVAVGALFLLGGIWELYQIQMDLVPILMIVVGGAMVLSLFRGRRSSDGRRTDRSNP